jgi:hypothetical protein
MSLLMLLIALLTDPLSDPCLDDDHNNRCSAAKQAEMRALYRVPSIETYADASVRRVFYVDGYGNDTVAIEFIRAAEKDALVRVHSPKSKGEEPNAPMEQLLTSDQWQEIINASEHFDRQFAPAAPVKTKPKRKSEAEDIVLCLHSWVYWAEAVDVGKKPRSTVNDACNDQPVEQFAWFAAKMARHAIPFCAALEKRFSRNEATLLRTCSRLSGDRLAAAEVWNRANGLRSIDTPDGLEELPAYDLELDFQGKKLSREEARAFWRSLMTQQDSPNFYFNAIRGLSRDQVVVNGELVSAVGNDEYNVADVELRWLRDGGTFQLQSMKVEPYRHVIVPIE